MFGARVGAATVGVVVVSVVGAATVGVVVVAVVGAATVGAVVVSVVRLLLFFPFFPIVSAMFFVFFPAPTGAVVGSGTAGVVVGVGVVAGATAVGAILAFSFFPAGTTGAFSFFPPACRFRRLTSLEPLPRNRTAAATKLQERPRGIENDPPTRRAHTFKRID